MRFLLNCLPLGKNAGAASSPESRSSSSAVLPRWASSVCQCAPATLRTAHAFSWAALQFARLSGFSPIITSASLHNTELLKSLGATHVLDRKLSPEALSKEARAIAGGYFDVVYDAISLPDTLEAAYDATAPAGDLVVVLQTPIPGAEKNSAKRVHMAHGVFNTEINHAVGKSLREKLPELLESGAIKVSGTHDAESVY